MAWLITFGSTGTRPVPLEGWLLTFQASPDPTFIPPTFVSSWFLAFASTGVAPIVSGLSPEDIAAYDDLQDYKARQRRLLKPRPQLLQIPERPMKQLYRDFGREQAFVQAAQAHRLEQTTGPLPGAMGPLNWNQAGYSTADAMSGLDQFLDGPHEASILSIYSWLNEANLNAGGWAINTITDLIPTIEPIPDIPTGGLRAIVEAFGIKLWHNLDQTNEPVAAVLRTSAYGLHTEIGSAYDQHIAEHVTNANTLLGIGFLNPWTASVTANIVRGRIEHQQRTAALRRNSRKDQAYARELFDTLSQRLDDLDRLTDEEQQAIIDDAHNQSIFAAWYDFARRAWEVWSGQRPPNFDEPYLTLGGGHQPPPDTEGDRSTSLEARVTRLETYHTEV